MQARDLSYSDLYGADPGPGPGAGAILGGWSPDRVQGILMLVNSALAQVSQLMQLRASPGQPGGGAAAITTGRVISISDLNMADLKLVSKGLLQLAVDSLGDKTIEEILKDWGPVRLSQFEKML